MKPGTQAHVLWLHTPAGPQAWLQPPQCALLVLVLTHVPLQQVSPGAQHTLPPGPHAARPGGQAHTPPLPHCLPPVHALPHAAQLALVPSLVGVQSQQLTPGASRSPQLRQLASVHRSVHCPPQHVPLQPGSVLPSGRGAQVPLASSHTWQTGQVVVHLVQLPRRQFGRSGGQVMPQPPQLAGSLAGLTHCPPQQISLNKHEWSQLPQFWGSELALTQVWWQHFGFGPVHSLLHAPQWSGSLRFSQ